MKKILMIAAMTVMSVAAMAQGQTKVNPDSFETKFVAKVDSIETSIAALDAKLDSSVSMLLAQDLKFGYVEFNELVMLMPDMDQARAAIEENQKANEEILMTMYKEYETKMQQYQQNSATWTAAVREMKEKEIMQLEQNLQQNQQVLQQELQQLQQQLQQPIYEKAQKAVQDLAKAKGLAFVFEKNSLVYLDTTQGVDLTPEARAALKIPADRTLEKLQQEMQAKMQAAQAR